MAKLTRGQSFGATETITNTKLHNLVDLGTVTDIVDADISASAAIQFSKLLASSISGALLTNLNLIPSGAGLIPFVNIPVPFGSSYVSLVTIPNQSLQPLTLASWVDGVALRNLASTPVDKQIRYNLLVSSLASGSIPMYDGANTFVGTLKSGNDDYAAGTVIEASAVTERSVNSGPYVKLKGFSLLPRGGIITVTFEIHTNNAGAPPSTTAFARVYVNGIAVGTEQSTDSLTYVTKTENFTVKAGDAITVYCKCAGATVYIQNVYIKVSNPTTITEESGY